MNILIFNRNKLLGLNKPKETVEFKVLPRAGKVFN